MTNNELHQLVLEWQEAKRGVEQAEATYRRIPTGNTAKGITAASGRLQRAEAALMQVNPLAIRDTQVPTPEA